MKGFAYILRCADGSYYTGSTKNIEVRLYQHQNGEGANYTKKRLPVELFYMEEFERIDEAFYREKQIQGWSRKKKKALIDRNYHKLPSLSECTNESHCRNAPFSISVSSKECNAPFDSAQGAEGKHFLSEINHSLSNANLSLINANLSLIDDNRSLSDDNRSLSGVEGNNVKDIKR